MSFGEETQKIGNINTAKVLIFNSNDLYISVHTERGSVTHSSSRDRYGGLRTADSDEHNYCSHSSTAQKGVSHTHGVAR